MTSKFVADGEFRLMQAREQQLAKSIETNYASKLASAGFVKKILLRAKMMLERMNGAKNPQRHQPSAGTLW